MNFYNSVRHKFLRIRLRIPIPFFLVTSKKSKDVSSLKSKKVRPLFDLVKCDDEYESNLLLNARVNNKIKPLKRLMRDIDRHKGMGMKYFNGVLCTVFTLPTLDLIKKHAEKDYQNKILQIHSYKNLSLRAKRTYLKQKRRKYIKYKITKKKGGD